MVKKNMIYIQDRIQMCIAKIIQHNREVKNIFDEIYQQGGRVLLVGGAVRDCLLGCVGSDFDFEVYHISFEQLESVLQKFGKVSFLGKSFGVLRLHSFNADWSIPRVDSYGRKPTVELDPNMNFARAFRRRDLTINAMGIDVCSYELIDPFDGFSDLKNKVLRSPDVTFFVQDPLRLFRVMQLAARFDMKVDEALSDVCRRMDISTISSERIEQEFSKLFLKSYRPSIGFKWLEQIGRTKDVFVGAILTPHFYDEIDCISQSYSITDEYKLFALWAMVAGGLQKDELHQSQIYHKISQQQSLQISTFLKTYIGSIELATRAGMLSWYLRYVPLLAAPDLGEPDGVQFGLDDKTAQHNYCIIYKWIAYWISPYFTMETLGKIAACCFPIQQVELFVKRAKEAKVLYSHELPLISGKDLLDIAQGKQLGDLIKHAYELQINRAISDKSKLLQSLRDGMTL